MIPEFYNTTGQNSELFSLGYKSSSSRPFSKTNAVAARSFRQDLSAQKVAQDPIVTGMTQPNIDPSLNLARAFIVLEEFEEAEEVASGISDLSIKELVFVELAEAAFKNGEFQRADAVARRISSPLQWERVLSIFLEFKPEVVEPKKSVKEAFRPILRQLKGPPVVARERGVFGSIEILTDHRVRARAQQPF